MATRPQSRFWRTCRTCFRRFRIAVWLVVLALVATFVYLNQVGLPGFVKEPLLQKLRARGLDLRFSRLRLRWYRGLVLENVRFERADEGLSPQFTIKEVQVRLNHHALARLQLQIDSLVLRQGRLVWPIAETLQAPRQLAIENIQTDLSFFPNDLWSLDHFTASFAGARIKLSGTVANGSAVREWKFFQAKPPAPARVWQDRLRQLADTLERIRFSAPPELTLDVRGDARELQSFTVRLGVSAPGADTPWGSIKRGRFAARLYPVSTNGPSRADLSLEADEAQTRWGATANVQLTVHLALVAGQTNLANGDLSLCAEQVKTKWGSATNLQLSMHAASVVDQTNLVNAELALRAAQVQTQWGSATDARFNAQWAHALTNPIPLAGNGQLRCDQVATRWGAAKELRLNAHLVTPASDAPTRADASWAWWASLEPYALNWDCQLIGLQARELQAEQIACNGSWRAPALTLTNLHAEFYRKQLEAHAALDVATRALHLSLSSDIDPHRIAPFLTEGAQRWLAPYSWDDPPHLKGEMALVLPAWTNTQPDWRAEVQPSLRLQGDIDIGHGGAWQGWSFTSARSHLMYSNGLWRLPDLTLTRPEGSIAATLESNDRTKDFYFRIDSTIDLRSLRPLLDPGPQRGLDYFTFTEPPVIAAEIWGRWHDAERTGIKGRVALTNFTFRGESASGLQTALQYTNRFLQFTHPRLQRGAQQLRADGLGADFVAQKIYLTNGFSTAEPTVIARAIGPHIARTIEAYRFDEPPAAHVHGIIPMHGEDAADLHFDLKGGPFHWWRFHVPEIAGHLHWLGQHLTLSNVLVRFYDGDAQGAAGFDFHPGQETDYHFAITTTNTLLRPLMSDLFTNTNRLEGALSGTLVITNANTDNLQSWNGSGNLQLQDGLIWEIPIFGIFSDVLNGMVPGLGSSRASAGACTFGITNGVIRSNDLDIRSTAVRLQYRGTVDFEGRVKARVEAGLLHDVWLVGPVVSTVFWPVTKMFEYKVTGSLGDPKAEPVYLIPKFMLLPFQMPFHPLRTLKGFLPADSNGSRTNSPPLLSPKQQ
jgi:hypothetical protein